MVNDDGASKFDMYKSCSVELNNYISIFKVPLA